MADLLVRGLDEQTVERLKERARQNRRSLQSEAKAVLEAAATYSMGEARAAAEEWQRRLAQGTYTDSADALHLDRER
jgi:antitoxin FitA